MQYYPVVVGHTERWLHVILKRLSRADLVDKILDAYRERRECVIGSLGIGFRVRNDGAWALAFWSGSDGALWGYVGAIAGPVAGVELIDSGSFGALWAIRQNAEATFGIFYCAKPDVGGPVEKVGTLTVTMRIEPSGAYRRIVACKSRARQSGKVSRILQEAEQTGTIEAPAGGYLASTPAILRQQLLHWGLDALERGCAEERAGHFQLRELPKR